MAAPTRQQPNRVLSARVNSKLNLEPWPYLDYPGDPWWQGGAFPKPYRWELDVTISQFAHGDPSTREPYRYNGIDVNVGDWIADTNTGASLKIIQIPSKTETTATLVVEDVDRYNTFLNEDGIGIFVVPADCIIFKINDLAMPIINPLPVAVSIAFSQLVLGRFQNNNPLYRTRVFQTSHSLVDNDAIWVDPADGLFKPITNDTQLKRMVGTVDRTGPGNDVFYFIPTTKVVEGIDPPLPGSAGDLIYVDALTGDMTADPTGQTKVSYIQLTNATPDTTVSNLNTVVTGSVLSVNDVDITFTGTTLQDVVDDINLLSSQHLVDATLESGTNSAVTNPADLGYGVVASLGTGTVASINGVSVSFTDVTNGSVEFGTPAANAVDMANSINAASIPNITADGVGSASLTITNTAGGAITIVNIAPDDSAFNFAGAGSCTGLPLSTPAGGLDFISFVNPFGNGIIFKDITGTPVSELGLVSVRNGELPKGLVVEQFVLQTAGGVTVYPDLISLPAFSTVGSQAYVIDSADSNGNRAGEWTMFLWDGTQWVDTSNEDSATTDAKTLEVVFDVNSPTTIPIGTLSNNRRVIDVMVIVESAFDGTPSLEVGDIGNTARLISDNFLDLGFATSYFSSPNFVYQTGNDVDIIATFSAGGATTGFGKIIISFM